MDHIRIVIAVPEGAETPQGLAEAETVHALRRIPQSVGSPIYDGCDRRDGYDWHRWTITAVPVGDVIR